jgi:hypothetical protein
VIAPHVLLSIPIIYIMDVTIIIQHGSRFRGNGMWIVWAGAAMTGFMWGWLAALRISRSSRMFLNALAWIAATIPLGFLIAWKIERTAVLPFLIPVLLSFCLHLAWRYRLQARFTA